MDDLKATEVLKSLAAGIDPATGGELVDVAALRTREVVDALQVALDAIEMRARQQRRQAALPRNAGKPWSHEEDERLLRAYDGGATVDVLTSTHERTRAGIEARLVKHGRLELEQAPAARIR